MKLNRVASPSRMPLQGTGSMSTPFRPPPE